jgi:hypothetical protein
MSQVCVVVQKKQIPSGWWTSQNVKNNTGFQLQFSAAAASSGERPSASLNFERQSRGVVLPSLKGIHNRFLPMDRKMKSGIIERKPTKAP